MSESISTTPPSGPAGAGGERRPRGGLIFAIGALVVFVVLAGLFGFTAVSTEEQSSLDVVFDPVSYVSESWDDVQTVIRDEAVPLADVLHRITPDADGRATTESLTPVAEELGRITTGNAHVYRVDLSGTVTDVDTETSRGSLGMTVDGYEGPIAVRVYIGSRIPSDESSVRDATGFIEFGDFREQTEYGKVAAEINKKVLENLAGLDVESLVGKPVTVTGAFTLRTQNQPSVDVSQVSIVPIEVVVP
jgi:predicted lipoprotein